MNRLTFGDHRSPFVAIFATRKTAADFGTGKEEAVKAINKNLFINDYLESAETEEEAIKWAKEVKGITEKGAFHLTGWVSYSESVMKAFQSKWGERKGEIPLTEDDKEKILGVCWKPKLDVLTFRMNDPSKTIFSLWY